MKYRETEGIKVRRLGFDLSQARLQAIALSLGIDQSFNSMTQAEKAQLRYYAILTQVTDAQGDMARTLNAPANQLRIFKAQIIQAARAIGSIFIPALNAILPYAIAVTKVIRLIATAIASLFGFKLPEFSTPKINSSVGNIDTGTGNIKDNLGGAAKNAKKLKSYLLGIDELNVFSPPTPTGGGGGGAGGIGGGGGGFDFELPEYDFLGEAIETRFDQIFQKMKEWLGLTKEINTWSDFFHTRLGKILTLVGIIGGGFALWKLSQGFVSGIKILQDILATPNKAIILGLTLSITGITLQGGALKKIFEDGMSKESFGELFGGGILGTLGGGALGKGIGTLLGSSKGGIVGLVIGAVISQITSLIGGIKGANDSWDIESGLLLLKGGGVFGGLLNAFFIVKDKGEGFFTWLKGLSKKIKGLFDKVKPFAKKIKDSIIPVLEEIKKKLTPIIAPVKRVGETFKTTFHNIGVIVSGTWGIIQELWGKLSNTIDEKIVNPIKEKLLPVWNSVKEKSKEVYDKVVGAWQGFTGWVDEVTRPLREKFSDAWSKIKTGASDAWEGVKKAFSENKVINFFKGTFSNTWAAVKGVFSGDITIGFTDAIRNVFNGITADLRSVIYRMANKPVQLINAFIYDLRNWYFAGKYWFANLKFIPLPFISGYGPDAPWGGYRADGGFVGQGQMFVAREAGPELVGSIGGRTAVANNDQIVEAVSIGVYNAVVNALGETRNGAETMNLTINLDGEPIYDSVKKVEKNRGYDLGMGAFVR